MPQGGLGPQRPSHPSGIAGLAPPSVERAAKTLG